MYRKILKKFKIKTICKIPGHIALEEVDVWFQDEARFGQQNTTTRLWAEKGTRPRAVKQQQFANAYLFGAVCPATGATEALIAPYIDMDIMRKHLQLISERTEYGRHAVIIVDGAAWHQESLAEEFSNISIIKLPPYSPELNPIEQVWQWLRQNELANRCFAGYEDIVIPNPLIFCSFMRVKTHASVVIDFAIRTTSYCNQYLAFMRFSGA